MPNDVSRADPRFEPSAIAERDAQITQQPQRIAPLAPEEISGSALAFVKNLRRAAGLDPDTLNEVPGYMSAILRHPDLYPVFCDWGLQLLGKGQLSPRHRELAILRVGWLCRAPFEFGEHVGIAKRCGFTTEEIERAVRGSSDPAWTPNERAILRAVEELHDDAMISDETWAALAAFMNEQELIELPFLIGHYHMVAFYQNALRLRPAAENPGLAAR